MTRNKIVWTTARALTAIVLAACAGAVGWAVVDDAARADIVPEGTIADGRDIGGMSIDAAKDRLGREVADPLLAPLTVRAGTRTLSLDPDPFLQVDVDGMVQSAMRPRRQASLPERVRDRVLGRETGVDVPVLLDADKAGLARWVDELAEDIDAEARDATLTVKGVRVHIKPARTGRKTKRNECVSTLTTALLGGQKRLVLPVEKLEPKVDEQDLGKTIVVRLSERRLYLYDGEELEKKYGVAVGSPRYPTPTGWWEIVQKRYMPSWSNPGSAWAAGMPRSIPPGPSNPLGTRALNLDASGIRIHGTTNNASIGTAASHGCMRMHRWDIEDLYGRVEVGTRVVIVH